MPDVQDSKSQAGVLGLLETMGKDHLFGLARDQLPACMCTKYAEIAETCLTCLDPRNAGFEDASEFEDEDGIFVGVRYIEKVSDPPLK